MKHNISISDGAMWYFVEYTFCRLIGVFLNNYSLHRMFFTTSCETSKAWVDPIASCLCLCVSVRNRKFVIGRNAWHSNVDLFFNFLQPKDRSVALLPAATTFRVECAGLENRSLTSLVAQTTRILTSTTFHQPRPHLILSVTYPVSSTSCITQPTGVFMDLCLHVRSFSRHCNKFTTTTHGRLRRSKFHVGRNSDGHLTISY